MYFYVLFECVVLYEITYEPYLLFDFYQYFKESMLPNFHCKFR